MTRPRASSPVWTAVSACGVTLALVALVMWCGGGLGSRVAGAFALSFGAAGAALLFGGPAWRTAAAAGGAGGAFFSIHAAHALPWAGAPWIAGALLVMMSVAIVFIAVRESSEPFAVLALALAWLSITLHPFAPFTLYANLLLFAAGAWFLFRFGWKSPAIFLLPAVYAGFLIWMPSRDGRMDLDRTPGVREFWMTVSFFAAYWAMAVLAVARACEAKLAARFRAGFAVTAHALFFASSTLILPARHPDWFWRLAGVAGLLCICASFFFGRQRPARRDSLIFAALLFALALVSAVAGRDPAPLLAIASALFVLIGHDFPLLRFSALLAALFAAGCAGLALWNREPFAGINALFTGAVLLFIGCRLSSAREIWNRWSPGFFIGLGLALWLLATLVSTPAPFQPALLAAEALVLTASFALLRVPEIPYLAKGFLVAAQLLWFAQWESLARPWWVSVAVVAGTIAVSLWWQRKGRTLMPLWELRLVRAAAAAVAMAIALLRIEDRIAGSPSALVIPGILALAFSIFGLMAGDWFLAAFAQGFAIAAIGEFVAQFGNSPKPGVVPALLLIANLIALAALAESGFRATSWQRSARWLAAIYRIAAALMFVTALIQFAPAGVVFPLLSICALALMMIAVARPFLAGALVPSVICGLAAMAICWATQTGAGGFRFLDLVAFIALLVYRQKGANSRPRIFQEIGIIAGIGTVVYWVSNWAPIHFPWAPLAAVWGMVALIVLGFGWWLDEAFYRMTAAALLVAALLLALIHHRAHPLALQFALLVLGIATILFAASHYRRAPTAKGEL
jgi:hypothetical protein